MAAVTRMFEHQQADYASLLSDCLRNDMKGTAFLSYFTANHPPYPTARTLRELVEITREFDEPPGLTEVSATVSPGVAADRVLTAGAVSEVRRAEIIREAFETSLARYAFASLEHFEEVVDREIRERRRQHRHLDAERPIEQSSRPDLDKLPRSPQRELSPAISMALAEGRQILPSALGQRLKDTPKVTWTDRVVKTSLGHWSITLSGKGAGTQVIRINRLLSAPKKYISDEMLAYLIYHELLHHLLPGQGHDAEFHELESRWPAAIDLDCQFATLHERWNTKPEAY